MKNTNRKGFTLIELLVVIAIIGLLSTMAVVSLNSARKKARDAKRVSDVKQMTTLMSLASSEIPNAWLECEIANTDTVAPQCADGDSTLDVTGAIDSGGTTITDPNMSVEFDKFKDSTGAVLNINDDNACLAADTLAADGVCQYSLEVDDSGADGVTNTLETTKIFFMTEGAVGELKAGVVHEITAGGVMNNTAQQIP